MVSWGGTGAPGASVACTWPATFGLSNVAVDQRPVAAAITAAVAARTAILRIVSPSAACERGDCTRISPAAPIVRRFTQANFFVVPVSCGERDPRRATGRPTQQNGPRGQQAKSWPTALVQKPKLRIGNC